MLCAHKEHSAQKGKDVMTRICTLSAIATICCGCQAQLRTTTPENVENRLTSFEQRAAMARARPWRASANERDVEPEHGRAGRNTRSTFTFPLGSARQHWSLGDFGESASPEDESVAELDGFWAEKEAKYLRRRPLPSFWETVKRDLKHMPEDIWRDTKRVYGNPVNLVILGTAYGGSLALQQTGPDRTVERHFREPLGFGRGRVHRHMSSDWRDFFGAAGNPGTHFTLAGIWYLAGQQTMDDKTYEVGKTLFSALAINGLTVLVGQAATFDRSPNGERGTFPSGHTSSSFVFASVMHHAYGHVIGVPLYGIAALVAHERLESGEHYLSDVVMGAVLGTVVGHAVASGRDPEFFGWKVVPWASYEGGTGVAIMKTIK